MYTHANTCTDVIKILISICSVAIYTLALNVQRQTESPAALLTHTRGLQQAACCFLTISILLTRYLRVVGGSSASFSLALQRHPCIEVSSRRAPCVIHHASLMAHLSSKAAVWCSAEETACRVGMWAKD